MFAVIKKIFKTGVVTESLALTKKAESNSDFEIVSEKFKKVINELYGGRSLRIRHVDAGSTNAEEIEMTLLSSPLYDIERFGISFVASPRHADILTVSGPVTRNLKHALEVAYEMMPEPRLVIAVGDGACDGGVWKDSYAVVGAVEKVIPVDAKIHGDPPSPLQIISGLTEAIRSVKK